MCPILAGWKLGDTVVNEREPAKTWTVKVTENKEQGRWIEIQNTPDCETIPGTRGMGAFESILVSMKFHAYRND